MKFPTIIKGSICVLGLVGAANLLAAPANAGQASARAAVTVSRADGATQTVSGEVVLPSGMYFEGIAAVAGPPAVAASTLTVTPTITDAGTASETIASLAFDAGAAVPIESGSNIESVIIDILQGDNAATGSNAADIQDAAAIIKAAGGVNGFAGLD